MAQNSSGGKADRTDIGWRFWLRWMAASLAGGGTSVLLWLLIGAGLDAAGVSPDKPGNAVIALVPAVIGAAFGTPFGAAQWLVLRRQLDRAGWWVPATIIGFIIVFALASRFLPNGNAIRLGFIDQVLLGAAPGAMIGIPVGFAQWLLVLRRQVNHAGWWVLASMGSWAIGFAVSFALQVTLGGPFFIAGFGVAVAISGLVMVVLLRQPSP